MKKNKPLFNVTQFLNLPDDWINDAEYQRKSLERLEELSDLSRGHIFFMTATKQAHSVSGNKSLLPVNHDDYEAPSKEFLNEVVETIVERGYSKKEIGELLGVSTVQDETVNSWLSGVSQIPYTTWLTLTSLAGLTLTLYLPKKGTK